MSLHNSCLVLIVALAIYTDALTLQTFDDFYLDQRFRPTVIYQKSEFRFLQFSRWNRSFEMLGFLSFFDAEDYPSPTKYLEILPYRFRLVIKLASKEPIHQIVTFCTRKCTNITIDTREGTEIMLGQWYEKDEFTLLRAVVEKGDEVYDARKAETGRIMESYVIFCYSYQDRYGQCIPVVDDMDKTVIRCECLHTVEVAGYVLVALFMVVFFAVLALTVIIYKRHIRHISQVQYSAQLCMPNQTSYEYAIIVRVGAVTNAFAYESAYIDFQLFQNQNDDGHLGIPSRFSCQPVGEHMLAEMNMITGRITQLPQVTSISAQHSELGKLLFFYGFTIVNLADNRVIQDESIGQYVTHDVKRFAIHPDKLDHKFGDYQTKLLACMMARLHSYEIIEIVFVTIAVVSGFTMLMFSVKDIDQVFFHWRKSSYIFGSLVLANVFVAAMVIAVIEILNRLYIKKNYTLARYRYFNNKNLNETFDCWQAVWKAYHWTLSLACLIIFLLLIYFSIDMPFLVVALWLGVSLLSEGIVLFIWYFVQSADCTQEGCNVPKLCQTKSDMMVDHHMSVQVFSEFNRSTANDDLNNFPVLNLITSVPSWSGEPKLVNPRNSKVVYDSNIDHEARRSSMRKQFVSPKPLSSQDKRTTSQGRLQSRQLSSKLNPDPVTETGENNAKPKSRVSFKSASKSNVSQSKSKNERKPSEYFSPPKSRKSVAPSKSKVL